MKKHKKCDRCGEPLYGQPETCAECLDLRYWYCVGCCDLVARNEIHECPGRPLKRDPEFSPEVMKGKFIHAPVFDDPLDDLPF